MKKAILYARVSTAMQERDGTIESQIEELKRQIAKDGNVLVKQYVDNGYSGARLDRPALDHLRQDMKTNLFDTIYFLNTDRIARDVTYQNIVISEILKNKKQVIINGKDYIHNPENKFSLTVLGAVAELERAKIIERLTRGKMHHLRQGKLLSQGHNIYGYNYIKKTMDSPPRYEINIEEAKIVKLLFEMYAEGKYGIMRICRHLEEIGAPRKTGRKPWHTTQLAYMLKNEAYTGVKYFNTEHYVREYANPIHGIKHTTGKVVKTPREEWIGIKIPQIIRQSLFDRVQAKIEYNKQHYRNPRQPQLLSNLVRCGLCNYYCFSYQRRFRDPRRKKDPEKVFHKVAYKCRRRAEYRMHAKNDPGRCGNPEIASHLLEDCVLRMIRETMAHPDKLKKCLEGASDKTHLTQARMEKKLKAVDDAIKDLKKQKKRILDLYATGDLDRGRYAQKSLWYDNEINKKGIERQELITKIPILHKKEVVDVSIRRFCDELQARIEICNDFNTKRQLFLDYIEKIVYKVQVKDGEVNLYGSIPVHLEAYNNPDQPSEVSKIGFCIEGIIPRRQSPTKS